MSAGRERPAPVALPAPKHAPTAKKLPTLPAPPLDTRRGLEEANRQLRDHQYAQAERSFQRVFDNGKGADKATAATGLGRVAFESGRYQDAVRDGERAVKLGGGIAAHMVLGDAYFKVQRYSDAAREYRAVLKKKPDHSDAQKRLNAALQRAGG
jgi:tetratricopeptide (TPR) repeat protein